MNENRIKLCKTCRQKMDTSLCGYMPNNKSICQRCGTPLEIINITDDDFWVIRHTSKDINFLEAMIKLHDEDIIAYEEKMSTFRANDPWWQEQHGLKQKVEEDNRPKCPHCHSTNISTISTGERMGSVMFFGLFSKKINKSFKCNDCKYTW